LDAERRQVTVLFTDMVGFTSFSERSGEEAAYTLMRSLSKLMDDAVREQGGVVQGFTGDGIMAVFGAPTAFEDAPLRACRAALLILHRLKAAGSDLEAQHGVRPQLRIGINTGPRWWATCKRHRCRRYGSRRHSECSGAIQALARRVRYA
jgi:class 3 adenylate cyclase